MTANWKHETCVCGDPIAAHNIGSGHAPVSMADYYGETEMTKGEYRVGVSFNPSKNPTVDAIKAKAAELIDLVESIGNDVEVPSQLYSEVARLKALAQTEIESAAMWAVKAATKQPG